MANDPIPADNQACKNCRFSRFPEGGPLKCYRRSPQIVPCPDSTTAGEWPDICDEDWCAEWEGLI